MAFNWLIIRAAKNKAKEAAKIRTYSSTNLKFSRRSDMAHGGSSSYGSDKAASGTSESGTAETAVIPCAQPN